MTDNIEDIDTLTRDDAGEPEYDPDFDNCGGGCERKDDQRVVFGWFQDRHFACPGCFEEIFGAPPSDDQRIITVPAATVAGRSASDGGAQ